jgi:mono/diheme cytochrome c family protein
MKSIKSLVVLGVAWALTGTPGPLNAHEPHVCPEGFPDTPALSEHVDQSAIDDGSMNFDEIVRAGREVIFAPVNTCDGQGRPGTTGDGVPRDPEGQPRFHRVSGPNVTRCIACHTIPRDGGAGDFVANPFVGAEFADPVIDSIAPDAGNERNSPALAGTGPYEMLAREMSADLQAQRDALLDQDGDHVLTTKGVDFEITIKDGEVVASRGVDTDLHIKPFLQSGEMPSIRLLTAIVYSLHSGMQPEELAGQFGFPDDPDADFDGDGVIREFTIGDMTAATIWQAQLATPGQVLPTDEDQREDVKDGERLFDRIDCTSCHVPKMRLKSPLFVDDKTGYSFDMTTQGEAPRLESDGKGGAIVRAYSDLKRHNLCDPPDAPDAIRYFCNEVLPQGRPDQDGRPGQEFFITRRLWDAGNSYAYGHRGDITTLAEAIRLHGGEARASRDAFVALSVKKQAKIISFLKTLQLFPPVENGS